MATWQSAIQRAQQTFNWTVNMCDNFVANMWGFGASGYNTAVDNWNASPSKHPNDMNAPAGALMYWGGGDGHVAISLGNGMIRSTDISGAGTVSTVPASRITQQWGKPYLGWADPFFQNQVADPGGLGGFSGTPSAVPATGTPASIAGSPVGFNPFNPSDWVNAFFQAIFGDSIKDAIERLALILFGLVLVMIAVIKFTKPGNQAANDAISIIPGAGNNAVPLASSARSSTISLKEAHRAGKIQKEREEREAEPKRPAAELDEPRLDELMKAE